MYIPYCEKFLNGASFHILRMKPGGTKIKTVKIYSNFEQVILTHGSDDQAMALYIPAFGWLSRSQCTLYLCLYLLALQ